MTHKKPLIKLRSVYLWHRYIGVTVALLVLLLSITGVLLNHTEEFELDSRYLTSDTLLNWYGIGEVGPIKNYIAGTHHISQLSQHLYINSLPINGEFATLQGAVIVDDLILVALDNTVLLLAEDSELIDRLPPPHEATNKIQSIGLSHVSSSPIPVLQTKAGFYQANQQLTDWHKLDTVPNQVDWSTSQPSPETIQMAINKYERAHVVDMERFVLDLHSGRILGDWGVWLMDAAALLMILLSVSGLFLWLNQRRKRRQHKQR